MEWIGVYGNVFCQMETMKKLNKFKRFRFCITYAFNSDDFAQELLSNSIDIKMKIRE